MSISIVRLPGASIAEASRKEQLTRERREQSIARLASQARALSGERSLILQAVADLLEEDVRSENSAVNPRSVVVARKINRIRDVLVGPRNDR
jgi:hypothetical protein